MDDIDPESIDLFFNYLKYKEKPDPNSLWLEKPITYDISYEESDNKSFFERYPFTIDRDSIYSQINMDSWSENDKKKYTSNPYYTSGAGYATGVDSHFSVKTSDNTNITYDYNYTELPSGVKVNGVIEEHVKALLNKLKEVEVEFEYKDGSVIVNKCNNIKPTNIKTQTT